MMLVRCCLTEVVCKYSKDGNFPLLAPAWKCSVATEMRANVKVKQMTARLYYIIIVKYSYQIRRSELYPSQTLLDYLVLHTSTGTASEKRSFKISWHDQINSIS